MIDFKNTNHGISARPCEIPGIKKIIADSISSVDCYSAEIHDEYIDTYFKYLSSNEFIKLKGIEKYTNCAYIHGTTQAFDEFYLKHSHLNLRCFPGEFAYHRISLRSQGKEYREITDSSPLKSGDSLIVSVPFSASCELYPDLENILSDCDKKKIPVHLDMAYLGISSDIEINLEHSSIYSISLSLSKVYYGVERLRIGLRLKKNYEDDQIDFANEYKMYNIVGAWTALELIKRIPPYKVFEILRPKCESIAKNRGYRLNKTCIFASIDPDHKDYLRYKRGNSIYSRICLSEDISKLLLSTNNLFL